ncbi:MAG: hypothetical protein ABFC55_06600 [Tenuifilaceae bacterium]
MACKYLLLIALLHFGINSFSQNEMNMMDKLNIRQDLSVVNNRITRLLNKDPYFSKTQGVKLFHIFWLTYQGEFRKEDFLNQSFLNKLVPSYYTQKTLFGKKKYLATQVFISDSTGHLIATSDGRAIYSAVKYKNTYTQGDLNLLRIFYKSEMDFIFYIELTSGDTYFGTKGKDIYVLKQSNEELKIYPLEEFINCCWDKLHVPTSNLQYKRP